MNRETDEDSKAVATAEGHTSSRAGRHTALLASLMLLGLIASCSVYCIRVRDEARSNICSNRLKSIWISLNSRHTLHGAFPPAYLCEEAGKPINSWRAEVI